MRKNDLSGVEKGGDGRHKFVQTLLSASEHKALRLIALEKDITLAELLKEMVQNLITKEKER